MKEQFPRPLAQRQAAELLKLPPAMLKRLRYEWELWQLPHQVPPDGDWAVWLNIGGRGSGKTTGISQQIRKDVDAGVKRFNFIGRTAASVRDDMVRGEAGVIAAFPPHQAPQYIASQSVVRFHTGAEALLLTAEEPRAIQGKNAEKSWLDEISTYGDKTEEVWTQTVLATRVGDPKIYGSTNSLPENPFLEKLIAEADERRIAIQRSTSFDNFANLPPLYQRQVRELMRTALGRAWVLGESYQPQGALWKREWFKYLPAAPSGGRTVVAVDPAGTTSGDETGIVVARRVEARGYILEDASGHHDAEVWPKKVVEIAQRWGASCIVIERNRGLDFLRALIRPHDRAIPLKEINVVGKKADRFAPVSSLYELGRIFHCPQMTRLEEQMCNWDPNSTGPRRSPDRVDAAVYAINELGFHLGVVDMSLGRAPRRDR